MKNQKISFAGVMSGLNRENKNVLATIVDPIDLGEKALVSNGEIVWKSKEKGFFSENRELIQNINKSCLIEINGKPVFSDVLGQKKKMVICGAGHVSIPIIKMANMIGFSVTVIEDRPKFADNARKANADVVLCDSFDHALSSLDSDAETYYVIVTRGHRFDQTCLEIISKKPHAYIGMMGSARRVIKVKEAVIENGCDKQVIENVYTPIGLHIGAETPEEIAISVIAEIIEIKNKQKNTNGFSREIMEFFSKKDDQQKAVLATIVRKRGAAPRKAGTKMVFLSNGETIDTIGGGCMEAIVQRNALQLLMSQTCESMLLPVDLSAGDAENEGMVCGGQIEVLLELI